MQYRIVIFITSLFLSSITYAVPPAPPEITTTVNQQQLNIDFTANEGLTYKLYYALYPQQFNPLNIQSVTLDSNRFNFSPLPDEGIFAVAVTAINSQNEESPLSTIEWVSLNEKQSAGLATSTDISVNAYRQVVANLTPEIMTQRAAGLQGFNQIYTTETGLGKHYNDVSCNRCHQNNGRGTAANSTEKAQGLIFKISSAIDTTTLAPLPIPTFGLQLHDQTTSSTSAPQADISISYSLTTNTFTDGTEYQLRRPIYDVTPFINLPNSTLFSPRLAPALYGIGLLALVPDETILNLVKEQAAGQFDTNNDGIVNVATDPDLITGKVNILGVDTEQFGRFGLKSEQVNIIEQIKIDFSQSMGIDENNQNNELMNQIQLYLQTLAVPERRNINDPNVRKGQLTFALAACATCHTPTLKTGVSTEFPALSEQIIHPYTDLLLHDMGSSLADGKPSFSANTQEWRTPALWGIGLRTTVNREASYLHDGRARNIIEAIMWHSGEAASAREYVNNLNQQERDNLVLFIQSL